MRIISEATELFRFWFLLKNHGWSDRLMRMSTTAFWINRNEKKVVFSFKDMPGYIVKINTLIHPKMKMEVEKTEGNSYEVFDCDDSYLLGANVVYQFWKAIDVLSKQGYRTFWLGYEFGACAEEDVFIWIHCRFAKRICCWWCRVFWIIEFHRTRFSRGYMVSFVVAAFVASIVFGIILFVRASCSMMEFEKMIIVICKWIEVWFCLWWFIPDLVFDILNGAMLRTFLIDDRIDFGVFYERIYL